jgi:hypothetical protein
MRFIKERIGRTAGPVLVCTAILAVLGITAAVAAPKFVTGKKVVTTIVKKVQGSELQVATEKNLATPSFDLNQPSALIADQKLAKGSYMVRTSATVTRTAGLVVQCELRVGKRIDRTEISGAVGSSTDLSLGISAGTQAGGGAQLRCADGTAVSDGIVKNIEIQSLRVPKLTIATAP